MAQVVADTSPLIALQQIGRLDLLRALFGSVLIPSAVAAEALSVDRPEWLIERPLTKPLPLDVTSADLEPGESEAIALALELSADRVLIDEMPARKVAERLGLPLVGTLGILLLAKRSGVIEAVREPVDALRRTGFHMSTRLYEYLLREAGEGP
jgi:hypothetical protein